MKSIQTTFRQEAKSMESIHFLLSLNVAQIATFASLVIKQVALSTDINRFKQNNQAYRVGGAR